MKPTRAHTSELEGSDKLRVTAFKTKLSQQVVFSFLRHTIGKVDVPNYEGQYEEQIYLKYSASHCALTKYVLDSHVRAFRWPPWVSQFGHHLSYTLTTGEEEEKDRVWV